MKILKKNTHFLALILTLFSARSVCAELNEICDDRGDQGCRPISESDADIARIISWNPSFYGYESDPAKRLKNLESSKKLAESVMSVANDEEIQKKNNWMPCRIMVFHEIQKRFGNAISNKELARAMEYNAEY